MAATQYNRIIRKLVVGFGNLFNDITLVRYNKDLSEAERLIVPIVYADKELYVRRLEEDYTLDKKVQMTLPRMSFEMSGLTYDSSRKQNTNIKNVAKNSSGVIAQYNPVPYNFDFNLYIYVRNIEDGTQIIEHILPYFTPDYTIKLNLVPEMGIVKEVPVILNSTSSDVVYEGNRDAETRMIVWTLNFTAKGFIYGKTTETNLITTSITNVLTKISTDDIVIFNMTTPGVGNYQQGEMVYQGYSFGTATATARVHTWGNQKLHLSEIAGNFVSSQPIYGLNTNTNYLFNSYETVNKSLAQVITVATPTDANVSSLYTYNNIVNETPNIPTSVQTSSNFSGDLQGNIFGVDDLMTEQENPINLGS